MPVFFYHVELVKTKANKPIKGVLNKKMLKREY